MLRIVRAIEIDDIVFPIRQGWRNGFALSHRQKVSRVFFHIGLIRIIRQLQLIQKGIKQFVVSFTFNAWEDWLLVSLSCGLLIVMMAIEKTDSVTWNGLRSD